MQIDERLVKKWRVLYDRGDAQELATKAQVHKNTIFNALRKGRTGSRLFAVMKEHFEARETAYRDWETD